VDTYRGWPDECEVWQEDAYLPPISFSPIGNCKRAVEQMGFLYSKIYGLSFVALRIGRVYGLGSSRPNPIGMMAGGAVTTGQIDLSDVPENVRVHPVYAKDMGQATSSIHLAHSLRHYIYNVADGSNPAMLEIAQVVRSIAPNAQITLGPADRRNPVYRGVDAKRVEQEFGFVFRDLRMGIADYIAELRSSNDE
jgi:nucleoside-diphosphate-sugar epimerase